MADVSISLDLQAKALYDDLQRVQSNFTTFASRVTAEGEKAASGFSGGFRGKLSGLGSAITGGLGALGIGVGVGAAIGEFEKVIEKAHEINHEAERFGLTAEQLQLIGNAAQQDGISLGQTARALNLLEINGTKATKEGGAVAASLAQLNVEAKKFSDANPAEKFLLISDAYKNSAKTGGDYAAVASLIGKRNTELIPIIAKGREEIEKESKAMGILSNQAAARLDEAHKSIQQFNNQVAINIGNSITWLDKLNTKAEETADKFRNFLTTTGLAKGKGGTAGEVVVGALEGVSGVSNVAPGESSGLPTAVGAGFDQYRTDDYVQPSDADLARRSHLANVQANLAAQGLSFDTASNSDIGIAEQTVNFDESTRAPGEALQNKIAADKKAFDQSVTPTGRGQDLATELQGLDDKLDQSDKLEETNQLLSQIADNTDGFGANQ